MPAQHAVIDQGLVEEQGQLFGGALALDLGAGELDAKAMSVAPRDRAFEAAEAVGIKNDLGALRRRDITGDGRAAGRQVLHGAAKFLAVDGGEKAAGDIDANAAETPALGPRLGDDRL